MTGISLSNLLGYPSVHQAAVVNLMHDYAPFNREQVACNDSHDGLPLIGSARCRAIRLPKLLNPNGCACKP